MGVQFQAMTHPIIHLQAALVAALRDDPELAGVGIFDAPPRAATPPCIAIARHDIAPRDGDLAPGHEHRVVLHAWAAEPSRRAAVELAERVLAVAAELVADELRITLRQHERTETAIDLDTGRARAAVTLRFCSEPVE